MERKIFTDDGTYVGYTEGPNNTYYQFCQQCDIHFRFVHKCPKWVPITCDKCGEHKPVFVKEDTSEGFCKECISTVPR